MADRLITPWTPEQVEALNSFQRSGLFHPFTCGGERGDEAHRRYAAVHRDPDDGLLVATADGWHCPVCGYRQAWAYPGMAAAVVAPAVTEADRLVWTAQTVTRAELLEILGDDEDDESPKAVIATCAGEWRREGADCWRAWTHLDVAEDDAADAPSEKDPTHG